MIESMQSLLELQTLEFGGLKDEVTAAAIATLRSKISAQILGHYDRLRVRGKKGIVPVQNQVCAGCHMRLPLAVIMTLKHGQDIQLCDTCGRYLYLADGQDAPAEKTTVGIEPPRTSHSRRKSQPARAQV